MSNAKEAPVKHDKISKEMGQFYLALGAFNANMIAKVINDPAAVKPVTKHIIAVACPDHDAQCADGHMWNHTNNACTPIPLVGGGD